jgi:hypothetical protein
LLDDKTKFPALSRHWKQKGMIKRNSADQLFRAFRGAQQLHRHAPNLRQLLSKSQHADVRNISVNLSWLVKKKKSKKTNARAAPEQGESAESAAKRQKTGAASSS